MEWSGLHKIHFLSMNALLDAHQLLQGRWDMLILQVLAFLDLCSGCKLLYSL